MRPEIKTVMNCYLRLMNLDWKTLVSQYLFMQALSEYFNLFKPD